MNIRAAVFAAGAALALAGAFAANDVPLSGSWSVSAAGSAASSGELIFRMTPGDGGNPVEVTVPVISGASDLTVARNIRRALGSQLRPDRFDVQLGEGANVLVNDAHGRPNFSLELLDSDIDNLRVVVRSVAPAASPTVPKQAEPANPPDVARPTNATPGATPPLPENPIPPADNSIPSPLPTPPATTPPETPPPAMPPPATTPPPPPN